LPLARMERPVAGQRLRVMLFNKMMKELSKDAQTGLGILHGALDDTRESPAFRTVLCHTVRLGSVINFGNAPKAEAEGSGDSDHAPTPVGGFCLDALSRLALFRAPGNAKITLLHVLVAQVSVEDASLHVRLQEEIGKVHKAAKRSLASLSDDIGAFNREAEFFANCAASAGGPGSIDTVVAKLADFSEHATTEAAALVQQLADARAAAKATLSFFAMQARPAEVDAKALELCVLLSEFLVAFEKARKEITQNPDLAVMCHSGAAEVLAKSEQGSGKSEQESPRSFKPRSLTAPASVKAPLAADAAATKRGSKAAAAAKVGGETTASSEAPSAPVAPIQEETPSSKDAAAAEGETVEAAKSTDAPAAAVAPAAEAPPADVATAMAHSTSETSQSVEATTLTLPPAAVADPGASETPAAASSARDASGETRASEETKSEAQRVAEESPVAGRRSQGTPAERLARGETVVFLPNGEEELSDEPVQETTQPRAFQDASVGSFNTLTPPDSPRALEKTDSFMALITDEVEAAAAVEAEAAAAADALDKTAGTS